MCALLTLIFAPSTSSAALQPVAGVYAGIADNAILAVLATQLLTFTWHMGQWIVDKYFREQKDKDLEVKRLQGEFHAFREEVARGLSELKHKMDHVSKLPNEEEVLKKLTERMEFMVFKAARDLGFKGKT